MATSSHYIYSVLCSQASTRAIDNFAMEQAQPLSKEKSPVTPLSGDADAEAARVSGPSVLETKRSDAVHRASAPAINPPNAPVKAPRKKPETPKRNFNNTIATRAYGCKYCDAKFSTSQSLGGHQGAHKREHAAKRRARAMSWVANASSQVTYPVYFGLQAIPVPGHPASYGPLTWSAPADVMGPAFRVMLEPRTTTNLQALAWHQRPAAVDRIDGMVHQPVNYNGDSNLWARVPPQSSGPRPPFADVSDDGSSLGAQGPEDGGLELSLRL